MQGDLKGTVEHRHQQGAQVHDGQGAVQEPRAAHHFDPEGQEQVERRGGVMRVLSAPLQRAQVCGGCLPDRLCEVSGER